MGHIGSPRAVGHKLAVAALVVGLGAATVGCSSGSGKGSVSLNAVPSGASARTPTGAPSGATSTGATPEDGSTPAAAGTAQPSTGPAAATPGQPGATTGTTVGTTGGQGATTTAPAVTTGPQPTTPASTGPAPATPGTYRYNLVSGSSVLTVGTTPANQVVDTQSSLVVSSTGTGQQRWANSTTTTNLVFNSAGVFLLSETVPLFNATCTFNAAVASPPWPLAVGRSFSGQASCVQGKSTSTLTLEGHVVGTASVPLDGGVVSTFMVQTTLRLSGTTLVVAQTDWYAPSLRLPVKTTVGVSGGLPGYYTIASTTTYALASSRPS